MPDMPPLERKRRARAAWGYSLLSAADLAQRMDVPKKTLEGWLAPGGAPPGPDKLLRIATACGRAELATAEWPEAQDIEVLATQVQRLTEAVAVLSAETAQQAQALREHREKGHPQAPPGDSRR